MKKRGEINLCLYIFAE